MGCCVSKGGVDGQYASGNKLRRENAWRRTGIVGLRDAGLKELPVVLFADANLALTVKTLDTSNNKLSFLPDTIGNLTNLRSLTLTRNLLTTLPLGLSKCANLRTLVLDDNQLVSFSVGDDFFSSLPKLTTLSLKRNRLTELPDGIGGLKALTSLHVNENKLNSLPNTIGKCIKLEVIDASGNESSEFILPSEIGDCANLTSLTLDNCMVRKIPPEILRKCTRLSTLSLHGCPINVRELEETPGWVEYQSRVKGKHSKKITGGVLIDGKFGLDDGIDRREERIVPHSTA